MRKIWNQVLDVFREASRIAFSSDAFHIIGKEFDNLTKRSVFHLKTKRIGSTVSLTTKEIIGNDYYLTGLSSQDREAVFSQYKIELNQPVAFIDSISISPDANKKHLIKIFLLLENRMLCMTAEEILGNKNILDMLKSEDVARVSKTYAFEKFPDDQYAIFHTDCGNVRYLK